MSGQITDSDRKQIAVLYEKTGGRAWEPPSPNHPWLVRMIEAGYLRRCDMRCDFEAMKDAGVTWTDAGHEAMRARVSVG